MPETEPATPSTPSEEYYLARILVAFDRLSPEAKRSLVIAARTVHSCGGKLARFGPINGELTIFLEMMDKLLEMEMFH